MSIEINSKWVKDEEVVECVWLNATCVCEYELSGNEKMVWYECDSDTQKNKIRHVLTERDFLEQYKPYKAITKMKVYIASPVRPILDAFKEVGGDNEDTIYRAFANISWLALLGCEVVKKLGHAPISPVLAFDGVYDEFTERDKIDAACEALLLACDFIYVVDTPYNERSKGIARELEIAAKNGIEILEV